MKKLLLLAANALFCVLTATAQEPCLVSFDLNYNATEKISPISVNSGNAMPMTAKPLPKRTGFRFGGWYTSPECRPEQEWRFGSNSVGFYMPATDSMTVKVPMTLYAKWVAPTPVRTVKDLDAIREDLYGWYVLENDIDLSAVANWIPIGEYEGNYEFAPGEWWRHAFKGILDGNGHTIRGLRITELTTDKTALFGTVANGVIRNLRMEDSRLELAADKPYVAPLAGILKQDDGQECIVQNCEIANTLIKVRTTNAESTFHSFTGLCGGAWGGTVENCSASGKMQLEMAGKGGGELYVGSFLGEAYNDTRNCSSHFDIDIQFMTPAEGEYKAFIGGLQSSATNVSNCSATGTISVKGNPGSEAIYLGGLIGSERYGTVENCSSTVKITALDMPAVQIGGIVGEFNAGYGTIGAAFGIKVTTVRNCSYAGTPVIDGVGKPVFGEISGAGQPAPLSSPWGLSMDYKLENNAYSANTVSEANRSSEKEALCGDWYGLYCGSPVTVSFSDKLQLSAEAFSSLNLDCNYLLLGDGRISVPDAGPGMAGEGIYSIKDGTLELLFVFGPSGQVQPPTSFNDGAGNPAATHLTLKRDRAEMDKATAPVKVPAEALVAFERNRRLGAGINLNSVLDGFSDGTPLKAGSIKGIADVGFQSIRIPIRWASHVSKEAPYTIDPAFFKEVDDVIKECLQAGLAVIIDNHYYPGLSFNLGPQDLEMEPNIERLCSIWSQISAHYKDYPDQDVFFELMNEPSLALDPAIWNDVVAKVVETIRKQNPGKTIMVGTPSLGQHWTIGLLNFPDDWNIIVDAHYYLPQTFTHQGLSYAMASDLHDIPWMGTTDDKAPLEKDFSFLARWSRRTGRPVCIGEYGVCANADEASRARYVEFIRSLIEQYGMGSHYWTYHNDIFQAFDERTDQWNASLLKAMNLPVRKEERQGQLTGEFRNPDLKYAPMVRWWWPGNDVENTELKRELELFASNHIGGVEIQPFALVVPMPEGRAGAIMSFDTDSYYEHLSSVMSTAARLGMTVDLTNGSGWPAASPAISEAEENRSLQYGMAAVPESGGTVAIPRSTRQDSEYATLIGLLEAQVKENENGPRQIKDVKELPLAEKTVTFARAKVEKGWQRSLIALWSVPSQEINMITARPDGGKVIDHFDSIVVQKTYDHYFGARSGLTPFYGNPFRSIFNDSYEFKVDRHITADFRDVFQRNRGYDPLPWMPANIFYGYNNMYDAGKGYAEFAFGDVDAHLRYDYDLTVSDLVRTHLLRGSSHWARERGLLHKTQPYGLPMDYIGAAGDADIPETENMVFGGGSAGGLKMVSSGAMLYGKTLVTAESGVHMGRGLMMTPQKLRLTVDKNLSSGVNQLIWHGAPYRYGEDGTWQPFFNGLLGINFSSDLSEANHFWEEVAAVNQYAQRAQYLMQQGKAVADVLVYYPFLDYSDRSHNPEELLWYGYQPETEPAMQLNDEIPGDSESARWLQRIWPLLNELERRGITWAWVNDESLQEMTAGKDGRLQIRGNAYKGLVLFELPYIQLATAQNLSVQNNANILLIGEPPVAQPSFLDFQKNDRETARLMSTATGGPNVCRDAARWAINPPVKTLSGAECVRLTRRKIGNGTFVQMYWNEDTRAKNLCLASDAAFAYWMNAEDGSIMTAERDKDGCIRETLEPLSTRFLYLGNTPLEGVSTKPVGTNTVLTTLPKWNLKAGDVNLTDTALEDWRNLPELSNCAEDAIYSTTFRLSEITAGKHYTLDLGEVCYVAEVHVNGKSAGKRIWRPYTFDITDYLQPGENTLEIIVKVSDYNAKVRQGQEGNPNYAPLAKGGLMANGLLGPVKVLVF